MKYWQKALQTVGRNVMIVSEADDLASQNALLCSPAMYRRFIKPRHARLFAFIKSQAQVPVQIFYHSCGAVAPLIGDLIESGVDILNPVQVSAVGMDTRELKRLFGRDLTFYGGGVDTQQVLPRGTPAQVRDEVHRRLDDLAPGGGFIFNTVHNIQADVPAENILAMWEALQEYGIYRR
jgi:uroporphyrinogen decarboxylase